MGAARPASRRAGAPARALTDPTLRAAAAAAAEWTPLGPRGQGALVGTEAHWRSRLSEVLAAWAAQAPPAPRPRSRRSIGPAVAVAAAAVTLPERATTVGLAEGR